MFFKLRTESSELRILRSLNTRMALEPDVKQHFFNLAKGFEGEVAFDEWTLPLTDKYLILNDLLLESNSTTFQIDSLLISQKMIYLFEVKNFEGDYYVEGEKWFSMSGSEINSPLFQMKRCETLLKSYLHRLKINVPIKSYLVFINPEFALYEAPRNEPIIFLSQMKRLIEKFHRQSDYLGNRHNALANQLVNDHLKSNRFSKIPVYDFSLLEKGILCSSCQGSLMKAFNGRNLICPGCGCMEKTESAVLRAVQEYKLLFPDRQVTTQAIQEWCGVVESRKTIREILNRHFTRIGRTQQTHYIEKD